MGTVITIVAVVAGLSGLGAFIFSTKSSPKDRAADAVGAATGGAIFVGGCLFQLLFFGLMALGGFWLLSKIFGH